jgi:hypothetical protein
MRFPWVGIAHQNLLDVFIEEVGDLDLIDY